MSRDALMHADHWVMSRGENIQPTPLPTVFAMMPEGTVHVVTRESVRDAARFAIRAATANGTILDFDPDALVIDLQNALCGHSANLGVFEPKESR
jgi:hypothetical protein